MSHQFSQVPQAKIPRSSFNRSHSLKTTLDAGWLVPILVDEVLPGDTHSCRASLFGRLATPVKPVMHDIFLETFFFFVPTRLVWDNFQKFNGEQKDPGDSTDYTIPINSTGSYPAGGYTSQTLADYLGIPTHVGTAFEFNALPFRCYSLIYNEWFRDQNLQVSEATGNGGDGPDVMTNYRLRRRGKRHDYFTSCLPWPQKGPDTKISIGNTAPVTATSNSNTALGVVNPAGGLDKINTDGGTTPPWGYLSQDGTGVNALYADLSNATTVTINQLRESFQIQKLLERDARGGTRYTEIVRSHFGVISPDARLQRPEFLGGGTAMVNVNPVPQTSNSVAEATPSPQGNLAAFGTVSAHNHGFTKSFTEHGYILGLVSFRADLVYQQGLNRLWSRQGRFDFYWPALAHLGEQAVLSKEIYVDGSAGDDNVFGYQERYAEYRYKPSMVTGKFRSSDPASLDVWHLAQDFSARPTLNASFIEENPPIDRISAVANEPDFLLDVFFNYRSVRPMPVYGVPGLIDHF